MKKSKAELTAERILDTAVEVFAEKGYSATTTNEIAKRASVAEGTIFRYFPKKKDLLTKAIYRFLDVFGKQIVISPLEKIFEAKKEESIEVILKAIIMDRVKLFQRYSGHFKVLLMEMQYHEELLNIFKERIVSNAAQFGYGVIDALYERGEIRDVNGLVAFRTFVAGVVFMLFQRQFIPNVTSGLTIEEEIDALIDLYLNGIRNREKEEVLND